MSYRSRLYNHRNAQSPEGDKKRKPFFSSKRGVGTADDQKKFFRADGGARGGAVDDEKGTTEERQARNKGDKVRIGVGLGTARGAEGVIQRQLAVPPTHPDANEPVLTPKQIHDAIVFNQERYDASSIRHIQKIVEATVNGKMNEETVRKIAFYQAKYGLDTDGKIGIGSLVQLHEEMAAEGASKDNCVTFFEVSVSGIHVSHPAPGRVRIKADVNVHVIFDPHCDCSRFEYRQFVSGDITKNGLNINNWINHAPGGQLPGMGNWIEDGDNTLPGNGPYGHRDLPANRGTLDHYIDSDGTRNMKSGCEYEAEDSAGIDDGPGVAGDRFHIDIRFMGKILKDGKEADRKFWAVRGNINL